jgi:hypothetical protein
VLALLTPGKKSKKDPNAPKRAPSAFLVFSSKHRAAVVAETPGIAFTEVGKELGRRWGLLSQVEKDAFKPAPAEGGTAEDDAGASDAEEEEADDAEEEAEKEEEEEEAEKEEEAKKE